MSRKAPEIDKRQFEDLVQKFQSLIPFYTREWHPEEGEPGFALYMIFNRMLEILLQRLNQVPQKHFIAFLNELGITRLPAQPAKAPMTFSLAEGTAEHVLIPEKTQIAAGDVVFETEQNILATPSRLIKAYSLDAKNDGIYESPPHIVSGKSASLFKTKLRHHAEQGDTEIFPQRSEGLQEGDILDIGESEYGIVSTVDESKVTLQHKLKNNHNVNCLVEKITHFELFEGKNLQEHVIYLGHNDVFNLKGMTQVELTFSLTRGTLLQFRSLIWEYWGERTMAEGGDEKISDWYPFSNPVISNGRLVLKKNNRDEITEHEVNEIQSRWIRCRVPSSQITQFQEIQLDTITAISTPLSEQNTPKIPDLIFYNDIPLDVTLAQGTFKNGLYPFGRQPRLFDTCYLGSAETFSKKGATITLDVTTAGETVSDVPLDVLLSWEYWNGKGWSVIEDIKGYKGQVEDTKVTQFYASGQIVFTCPDDIEKTMVSGQENYWIRIRLIHGGYGKVEFVEDTENVTFKITAQGLNNLTKQGVPSHVLVKLAILQGYDIKTKEEFIAILYSLLGIDDATKYQSIILTHAQQTVWIPDYSQIHPPILDKLTLSYTLKGQFLNYCLTYNNLEFQDRTKESRIDKKPFLPFTPLDDSHQTLYLGFHQQLEKGPVSLFFSIEEQAWSLDIPPGIDWEYYAGNGKWTRLDMVDETRGLARSGTIQYVFPQEITRSKKFGKTCYWIRAVDKKDQFTSIKKVYTEGYRELPPYPSVGIASKTSVRALDTEKAAPETTERSPCQRILSFSHPEWQYQKDINQYAISPKIKGIYVNTTWAVQAESVKNEVLGSSNGTTHQTFSLLKKPVLTEEIWVNELNTLSEQDKASIIKAEAYQIEETKDSQGNTAEFWVKWGAVEDLVASTKDGRHYTIDNVVGEIMFGDGIHGRIPPIGTNNIRAGYQIGGGSQGNIEAYEIKDLKSSLPFVEKAFNPLASSGGTDIESVENAIERGAHILKHRNRSMTAEDFEQLASKASRAIARAKCLPHIDNQGQFMPGWITFLVVPQSRENRPRLSLQLKRQIENYLKEHSANTVIERNRLQVLEPLYVEASVNTSLVAVSPDQIPIAERNTLAKLQAFFHPLTGGHSGQGWDFGTLPCFSEIYALLEKIEGVDHVESLSLALRTYTEETILSEFHISPEQQADVELPAYAIIYSGEHSVTVMIETS